MARRKDPKTGKLLPEGIYPVVSDRTGEVTYRARSTYSIGRKRRHMSKTHKTAKAAIDWKLDTDLKLNRGQVAEPSQATVDAYYAKWMARQKKDWSASKYLLAEAFWRIHAEPVLGGLRMQEVTRTHIQGLADRMASTLAPSSLRTYLANAKTMFSHAEEDGLVHETPFRAIRLPKMEDPERLIWSPLHIRLFLAKIASHRYGALWAFMIATGCRVSEAIGLRPDALDLDGHNVIIFRTEAIDENKRKQVMDRTKSGKKRHQINLEPWIVEILRAQSEGEYVFMHKGERVKYHSLRTDFIDIRDELNLPKITLHGLRHSVASMMSSAGVDIAIIKSIVGHTNIQTTANTYVQTSIDGQQIATKAAAKLLGLDVPNTTTSVGNEGESQGNASEVRQNQPVRIPKPHE